MYFWYNLTLNGLSVEHCILMIVQVLSFRVYKLQGSKYFFLPKNRLKTLKALQVASPDQGFF